MWSKNCFAKQLSPGLPKIGPPILHLDGDLMHVLYSNSVGMRKWCPSSMTASVVGLHMGMYFSFLTSHVGMALAEYNTAVFCWSMSGMEILRARELL